jgi:hypothetical protein
MRRARVERRRTPRNAVNAVNIENYEEDEGGVERRRPKAERVMSVWQGNQRRS